MLATPRRIATPTSTTNWKVLDSGGRRLCMTASANLRSSNRPRVCKQPEGGRRESAEGRARQRLHTHALERSRPRLSLHVCRAHVDTPARSACRTAPAWTPQTCGCCAAAAHAQPWRRCAVRPRRTRPGTPGHNGGVSCHVLLAPARYRTHCGGYGCEARWPVPLRGMAHKRRQSPHLTARQSRHLHPLVATTQR